MASKKNQRAVMIAALAVLVGVTVFLVHRSRSESQARDLVMDQARDQLDAGNYEKAMALFEQVRQEAEDLRARHGEPPESPSKGANGAGGSRPPLPGEGYREAEAAGDVRDQEAAACYYLAVCLFNMVERDHAAERKEAFQAGKNFHLPPEKMLQVKHYLDQAIRLGLDGQMPAYAYRARGIVHRHLKRNVRALEDLRKAIEIFEVYHMNAPRPVSATFAEAHNDLGEVLRNLGDYDEAVRHWELAITARPDLAAAHLNLAIHYGSLLGEKDNTEYRDKAVKHYRLYMQCEGDKNRYDYEWAQRKLKRLEQQNGE